MATATVTLINGLRLAAETIKNGAYYAWGHHGACNCGHLLQATTKLTKEEIRRSATTGPGEWSEIAQGECEITGAPFELLLEKLREMGMSSGDIHHLEYLSDKDVLQFLKGGFRWLNRNMREDVIDYFEAMSLMLEVGLHSENLLEESDIFLLSI